MDYRRFALPAACALALHAVLFFGFSKPPVAAPASPGCRLVAFKDLPPIEIDPVEPESKLNASDYDASMKLGNPRPQSDELIGNLKPSDFQIDITGPASKPDIIFPNIGPIGDPQGSIHGELIKFTGSTVVDSKFLDRMPQAKYQPSPVYPSEAKRTSLKGEVAVTFVVGLTGEVRQVNILSSSNPMFEEPTLRAVSKWRFEPGRRNGNVVAFRMHQPITFDVVQ